MMTTDTENVFFGFFGHTQRVPEKIFSALCKNFTFNRVGDSLHLLLKGKAISTHSWEGGFVLALGQILTDVDELSVSLDAREVAHRYQDRGETIAGEFDGVFAIVLWDAIKKKLFLWRDDSGARLLYYFQDKDNNFWFANTLQLLLKFVGVRPISRLGLSEYLRFLDISPPYTIFEDVFFLEPEKYACVASGKEVDLREKPTPAGFNQVEYTTFDEVVSGFDNILRKSIAKRIGQSVRIGSFLSGGIDSSLVCAVAADMRKDIEAVTVGFHDVRFDEAPVACKIAEHLGVVHRVMRFSLEEDLCAFDLFTATIGSPFADPAIIPTFQCFEKAGTKFDLVLDGTGADTLIGMMPARHLRFILRCSARLPTEMRSVIAKALKLAGPAKRYEDLFNFDDPVELLIRWKGWTKDEITALCGFPCDLEHTMFYRIYRTAYPQKTPYELYSMLMGNLPDDRIHQSRAIFGPEVSFPFFDHKIQTFVRSLPMQHRYAPDEPKKLFRHLLGRYVPQEIWDVPKHGFDYPFENLMRYRDNYLIENYLSQESLARHGLFDTEIVTKYVQNFIAGDLSLRFKIWALVVFQAWYENSYRQQEDGLQI